MTTHCGFCVLMAALSLAGLAASDQPRKSSKQESPATPADIGGSSPRSPMDPREGDVPLTAYSGWDAHLVIDNSGVGIWTVASFKVFPQLGAPEVIGLDDRGRCIVMVSYSGRWTPFFAVNDGKWLGGLTHGDIDPRIDGNEIYVGSQRGNIYQIVAYAHTTLDSRIIAHIPGREIHTMVAGDLDYSSTGNEIIVFTRPGGLYLLTPTGEHGKWEMRHLQDLPGRIRDAVVLPTVEQNSIPEVATVARSGRLELLRLTRTEPKWTTVHQTSMGMGRISLKETTAGQPTVLYSTLDDGRILRHERHDGNTWSTETIYLGPQGPRGIAAGQFNEDPAVETVAVFGYSGKVQLLTRERGRWKVETLFKDRDKGHWLAVAELDGRNNTRELLASGYSGRIVLLARPVGYGRPETIEVDRQ